MNDAVPDFYMGSGEDVTLASPRRCWQLKRLAAAKADDDMLVIRVDPPVPAHPLGPAHDLDVVIVAPHLQGDSLFPMSRLPAEPLPVYVIEPPPDWEDVTTLAGRKFEILAWAELYPSEAEARAKMTYAQARKYGKRI